MVWLSQGGLLREMAKRLPKSDNPADDALGGLRVQCDPDKVDEMVEEKARGIVDIPEFKESVKTCLKTHLKELHRSGMKSGDDKASGNGKFALDPTLFKLKYGNLDDFKKGVRELVGAPHPKVWEEMAKEHTERDDSKKRFNPGNYDMETCPEEEYMVCVDPKKGSEASRKSTNKRRVSL